MKFIVHDTVSAMAGMLKGPREKRPDALREMLAPMWAASRVPVPADLVDMHHQAGGFRADADDPRYLEALERLARQDVLGQIERELERASEALGHLEQEERIQVMFVLGDPDNDHLMRVAAGYYGMGGIPGWLYLLAWPTDEVIGRIGHLAVHEFHHAVRFTTVEWHPVEVTVGEHVISEGLAEAFVRELSGAEAMGPWSSMVTGEEYERARTKIMADFELAGMQHTSAYVLGDSAMRLFGQEPRGIPDMAGYSVGLSLVDEIIEATGMTAAQLSGLPVAELMRLRAQRGETKPDS
ncbi:DUF2268 domain-containing protein [Nonomuraea sp. ATR24]|uniref:DUF2268 domain-containing protein n=1 Tax=Nonomuraea TaxID=83681 RepID=UPI001C5F37CD|nr:DUF2268 domain-containing putative Zn-dependent protease [Nonomuraea ceibae]